MLLIAAAGSEQAVVEEANEEERERKVDGGESSWFAPVFEAAAEVPVNEMWWVVAE